MKTVRVKTSREYDVIIDSGLLDDAGGYIYDVVGGNLAAIVTDDIVAGLYLERLRISLHGVGYETKVFTFKNGEESKNIFMYSRILEFLAESRITRSGVVIALGGGVTGDLAGFAAATYMRGIPYVQIPTTLLAAVDSSVGGKTGVDLDAGKNLAGAFHQPKLVLCDYSLLEMLPPRIFVDGCAEVIKYAMIADNELFQMLGTKTSLDLEEIIARCVRIKRDIVSEDEFDTGTRMILNFGHTIGHAIEHLSKYNITHGKAVAIGMAMETLAAVRMGMCEEKCYNELTDLLHKFGLPIRTRYEYDVLIRAALSDKKRKGNVITLALPRRIGKCFLCDVEVGKFESIIKEKTSAVGEML